MRTLLFPIALLCSTCGVLVAGCGDVDDGIACTTEARSSVTVSVVDASGAPVTDATVQYSVDKGPMTNCEQPGPDGAYVCGYEQKGSFIITATRGAMTGTATVTVTADECHVIGQTVKITLGT
jgi:hypothetical protein